MRCHLDFETRSTIDLRKTGVHRYAEDPSTDVIMACWAVDDYAVETWFHTEPNNASLMKLLADPSVTVVAHNAGFERAMLQYILGPRYGWPVPALERWDDTAARAARQSLPRSLDGAADALGLSVKKDIEGKRLMMRMCRPRAVNDDGSIVWWDDEARLQRLAEYCATDVEVERELDRQLRTLTPTETAIWQLTEKINDRGVAIDTEFVGDALVLATNAQAKLDQEIAQITDGRVIGSTNVAQIKAYLLEQGFAVFEGADESLNKKAVETLLSRDLPKDVRRVLEIRQEGGKSSVAKYQAMADRVSSDGRVRGNLMYHGASTGRWSGAGVQLQNLPRDNVKDWSKSRSDLHRHKSPLAVLSKMIRGTIKAADGHRLLWADYAAVEARGVAWLAGQDDLVAMFATGGKVYEAMAAMIFDMHANDVGKDSLERFLGKTVVLGCGYSMGPQKFRQSCSAMGTDISEELAQRAVGAYRNSFDRIPKLWRGLEGAALAAVQTPGTEIRFRQIRFLVDKNWLLIALPSGRKLFYRQPRIVLHAGPFGDKETIEYMGVNSFTKKWQAERTFGGKLTENIVQGLCRDLIAEAMLALEAEGYPVIASVHDEVICEVPNNYGSIEEMVEIMCRVPKWAEGFPIAAEGKESARYGK